MEEGVQASPPPPPQPGGTGGTAPPPPPPPQEDQTRQVAHSRYTESRISHLMVHDIALADFQHRLARGESREGTGHEDEFINFDLGARRVRLQVYTV